ncbi:insulin receptor substrate 1-like isoform X1 [Trachemys scripta elegans]|uniref:insulin receptor substrate 1-like isoform X1 n=1 Tax=Trachemys scripta elegans TaxID=31138 RepID=UPI001553F5FE|nr:insulin receptor substrate 1-like isoform X1 [Trachemys scripta elegans]
MEEAAGEGDPPVPDVRLCGHLRKQKSQRRRFFVLRAPSEQGPARLEYYESEKKFRAGGARPKRSFPLASALNINKRADARHRHLIVLYGRDGTFGVAAESPEQQEAWYCAMTELRAKGLSQPGSGAAWPFREVWQVTLRPKGLGQARNLAGVHRLCLAESTVELVQLGAPAPCLLLQLPSVRRCGHSENYFFLEVGRSAATGPGELWMQVEDLVVARHIHETILEAMKRLSEECWVRGRGQASAPISVPARRLPPAQLPGSGRRLPDGDYALASSDEGGSSSPGEGRPTGSPEPAGSPEGRAPSCKRPSLPPLALGRGAGRRKPGWCPESGYMAMLPGAALPGAGQPDYVPMSPSGASPPRGEAASYMLMSPSGSWAPEYVNMSPLWRSASSTPLRRSPPPGAPGEAPCPFRSLPRTYKHGAQLAVPGRLSSCSSSTSSESLEEPVSLSPGEYVSIEYRPGLGQPARAEPGRRRCRERAIPAWEEPGLNYIALDLARGGGGPDGSPRAAGGPSPQAYASIDFHRSQELQGRRGGRDGPAVLFLSSCLARGPWLTSCPRGGRISALEC